MQYVEDIAEEYSKTFQSTGAIASETRVLNDDGSWAIEMRGFYTYDELIALANDLKLINTTTKYPS